jgi:hypothetical protein
MPDPVKDTIGLPFTLFRARNAIDYADAEVMTTQPFSEVDAAGMGKLMTDGLLNGSRVSLLFSRPGLSLTHVWFKTGFPLPRHTHNADCAYFIIAGTLRIGTEELGPGDGFFVGNSVPYTYVPGEGGVEVLEIRTSNLFDIKLLVNNEAWWEKAAARMEAVQPGWLEEKAPPSGMTVGG